LIFNTEEDSEAKKGQKIQQKADDMLVPKSAAEKMIFLRMNLRNRWFDLRPFPPHPNLSFETGSDQNVGPTTLRRPHLAHDSGN
jgi:hypothetical protein